MATTLGPDLFLFFFVFLLALASMLAGFDSLVMPDLISESVCACVVLGFKGFGGGCRAMGFGDRERLWWGSVGCGSDCG